MRRTLAVALLPVMFMAGVPDLVRISCIHHLGGHGGHAEAHAAPTQGPHMAAQAAHAPATTTATPDHGSHDAGHGVDHGTTHHGEVPSGAPCQCAGTCLVSGPGAIAPLATAVALELAAADPPPAIAVERRVPLGAGPEPFRQPWPLGPPPV